MLFGIIYLTHHCNGSATLMCGKSATCRLANLSLFCRVFDPDAVRDR